LKFGYRQGDAAPMALIELVDRPEPASTDEAQRAA
ncbi:MAG TPA: 50S ribosomal protein L17, partial [Acidimicrobiia bacterium]|nr:50S ribosomal protein L17 [Acidimicrobiia bacterium]